MPLKTVTAWSTALGSLVVLRLLPLPSAPPPQLALDLTTLHAAVLSAARTAADSSDSPYLLVSMVGSAGQAETYELPATGHWALRQDGAIGKTSITTLSLPPGDSVRILLSVLEDAAPSAEELSTAKAATTTIADHGSLLRAPGAALVTPTLAPLTARGAHWLGSVSLLLTNEGGTTYWSRLDCVATCAVLRSPVPAGSTGAELQATSPQTASGVVELSGASATYHLQVAVRRVP